MLKTMPSALVEMKFLESVIEFCSSSKIPFATRALNKIPKECLVKSWMDTASNIILKDVVPDDFWTEHSLERPIVPNSLSQECDENMGGNVLLLILWSSISDITHNEIVTCLKSGLRNWQYSELFVDVHWVEWYIRCICRYLRYYTCNGSKVLKEENGWSDCIDSSLSLECLLLGQVVKYTSELFRILVDPQGPNCFVSEFFDMMTENELQLEIHKSASLKDLTILDLNCNILYVVSISAWYKGGLCIPAMRKYFKIPCFVKFAEDIYVLLKKKHKTKDEYLNCLEATATAAAKELEIHANGKADNPASRLVVFTCLVTNFILNSNRKKTSEKEIAFMRMFFPLFVKSVNDQSIQSKLVDLIEKRDPPIFPQLFVVDMLESHFELDSENWPMYFLEVDSASLASDQRSSSNEMSIVSTPKGESKSTSKTKTRGTKSLSHSKTMATRSTKSDSKDVDDGTPVTSNVKVNVGKKRKAAPVSEKKVGKCSYSNCNIAQSILQKCAFCDNFNIHYQCHKEFFCGKKIPKDSLEQNIKLCWDCSKLTPKPPKTGSKGNKKKISKAL